MKKYKITSLYSEMVRAIKSRPYQVLRGTKTLALSSPKYHSFYKSSNDSLQTKTFKLPNESDYPKLIKSKYISLQKKINTFSFNSKNYQQIKPMPRPKTAKAKNAFVDKFKKKKKVNFFVGENYYKSLSAQKYKNYSHINNLNSAFERENKSIYELYSIKNSEKRVKDFFMLLNSIFYDEDYYYNDLKYNEKEIFGHKGEYLNYLKDELNYFLKKEKEFELKTDLLQLFLTKKYGKIELFLKSARIEVVTDDDDNKEGEKILNIKLPFHLMCLIYLLNGEKINYLIIILLKKFHIYIINEDHEEEKMVWSEEQKKIIFLEILKMVIFDNDNIEFNFQEKNYERYYSQLKYLEKIKDLTEGTKYNNFMTNFFKDHNVIKILDNSDINIYNNPIYKSNIKINFDTNINKYTLYIISLQKKYKVHLYLPEIELIFNNYKKQINHFIDKELFVFLYQNNFMYWDYYVLHYLFSFKNFRQFMNGILSAQNQNNMRYYKKNNYFLSKADGKPIKNNYIPQTMGIQTKIKKCYLSELYSYEISLNDNCYEFLFIHSNYLNLSLYKLKSYTLYAFYTNINKPVIYEFNFNFQQMKILYYISQFELLSIFLKKLLYIKDDNIYLEYSYFDSFSNMSNHEILTYFSDLNKMKEDNKLKEIEEIKHQNTLNSLNLKVCEPFIEVIDFNLSNSNIFVQSNIKLGKEFINDLINVNVNIKEWINKLNEYKKGFDIKYHVKYEDTRNKRIRRKITFENKNKDLHKVFNKFLKIS